MSNELDEIMALSANVPAYPKKKPRVVDEPRLSKSDKIKETALAIIEDTLKDKKDQQAKIDKKTDKATVPVQAIFQAFQQFESALGGRSALIEILQHCPTSSRGYGLLEKLLNDPDFLSYSRNAGDEDNVRYSLGSICSKYKIPFNAIVEAFKDAKTAEIALQSLQSLAPETPKVLAQLAQDSQNSYHACHICEGTGRIWRIGDGGEWLINDEDEHMTQLCHNCRGQGKVFKEHDVQNRKMFLQAIKILEDKKGPLVNNIINPQTAVFKGDFLPGDGSFESLVKAIDKINVKPKVVVEDIIDVPNTIYGED